MIFSKNRFVRIINDVPLCSIDILLKKNNRYLMCLRKNKPAKNYFFVPGGRILKNEKYESTIRRILKNELNIKTKIPKYKIIGIYNHIYKDNVFDKKGVNTHYFVCAIKIEYKKNIFIKIDKQHSKYVFMSKKEILTNKKVHKFAKLYLREEK